MKLWRYVAAVALAVGLAVTPSVPTQAAPAPSQALMAEYDNCWDFDAVSYFYTSQDGGYWYTEGFNVPPDEPGYPCYHIYVSAAYSGAFTVRVRFYLSNGTNYANSWKSACSICYAIAATWVNNGTHYRLEFREWEHITVRD